MPPQCANVVHSSGRLSPRGRKENVNLQMGPEKGSGTKSGSQGGNLYLVGIGTSADDDDTAKEDCFDTIGDSADGLVSALPEA